MQNTGFFPSFSKNGPAAAGPKGYSVGRGPHTKVLVPPAQCSVLAFHVCRMYCTPSHGSKKIFSLSGDFSTSVPCAPIQEKKNQAANTQGTHNQVRTRDPPAWLFVTPLSDCVALRLADCCADRSLFRLQFCRLQFC